MVAERGAQVLAHRVVVLDRRLGDGQHAVEELDQLLHGGVLAARVDRRRDRPDGAREVGAVDRPQPARQVGQAVVVQAGEALLELRHHGVVGECRRITLAQLHDPWIGADSQAALDPRSRISQACGERAIGVRGGDERRAELGERARARGDFDRLQPGGQPRDAEAGARESAARAPRRAAPRGRRRRAGSGAARAGWRGRPASIWFTSARPPRLSASSSSRPSSRTGAIRRSSASRSAGSETGLAMCPSMPASRQRSTSSAAVSAVSARIGIVRVGRADRVGGLEAAQHRHAQVEQDRVEGGAGGGVDGGLAVCDQRRGARPGARAACRSGGAGRRRPRRPARGSPTATGRTSAAPWACARPRAAAARA